ncbi:hypothetical protein PAXRUDRAFT_416013 [Paxillus rubicundulus Ve08.2h10]|uniref:Uncharacterized protein n=1 Tax=Paxillus rubicundulus Ve08.2h10 TaxID=930991 RepID=A0A0D0E8I7_9AGAM|nr:hypothetical protein PAXRUDRAFT_416013 [Paxillus rubicundulus Ve08.2h10]
MSAPVTGTMTMVTMGWANRGAIYIFSILPLGIVTLLTMMAAIYSLVQSYQERNDPHRRTSFDVSNTLHLIMASAQGGAQGGLAADLAGFDENGLEKNENTKVKLTELPDHKKQLEVDNAKHDPEQ